ncbi:hypothetical protein QDY66_01390 [Kingella negevensis]|uniref:hypothetical protein n=1 Tax=Kingella negevensis TaxID=1522312 RepID=UPI000BA3EA45|nr:hypothetical protein [Kingella negevensis]MDK4692344.1 hypothetical protein [Kingella negevensis]MDK4698646.1 hypothetical protein [Kingella negevensis]
MAGIGWQGLTNKEKAHAATWANLKHYIKKGSWIMTELFTLVNRSVAGQTVQTVNARELHAFLGNKIC